MDVGVGLAIGIAGRAINSLLAPHKEIRTGQRLENLNAPKSSYGVPIPRVWGRARVGGNLIWAAKLQEQKITQRVGGKNLWAQSAYVSQQYIYFGTAAYSFCRNLGTGRFLEIWANERLVWAASGRAKNAVIANGQAIFGKYIHWHPNGGNDSLFNVFQSLTQNDLGVPGGLTQNETEAYLSMRGVNINAEKQEYYPDHAYIVLDGLPLTYDYSNTFPTLSALVEERSTLYCKDVLRDLCLMAGYPSEDIDISPLANVAIDGYVLATTRAAGDAITEIGLRQPFTLIKRGKKLVFVDRANGNLWNIPFEQLGARVVQAGGERTPDNVFSVKETSAESLPQEVSLVCYDSQASYRENKFTSRREISLADGYFNTDASSITCSLVLSPSQAQQISDRILWELWQERKEFEFTLSRAYLNLEPGDAIQVGGTDWGTLKVTQVTIGANLLAQIKAVTYQDFVPSGSITAPYLITAIAPAVGGTIALPTGTLELIGVGQQGTNRVFVLGTDYTVSNLTITIPQGSSITPGTTLNVFYKSEQTQPLADKTIQADGNTTLKAVDVLPWNLIDPNYTIYLFATGLADWRGCSIYGSRDGQNYSYLANQSGRSIIGVTSSQISSTIDVTLEPYSPALISVLATDLSNNANLAVIGSELIQYQTVNQLSANTWRLSNLRRGLFNTQSQSWAVGTPFLVLSETKTTIQATQYDVNNSLYFKAVTAYQSLDDVTAIAIAPYLGRNQRTNSAVTTTAELLTDDTGNVLISDIGDALTAG